MRYITGRAFALFFTAVVTLAQSALAEPLVTSAKRSGMRDVTVRYEAGREAWAEYIAQEAPPYISRVERYLGVLLPHTGTVVINGCDDCGSRLDEGEIYLEYEESPVGNPALLFHELGHYWYQYWANSVSQEWLIEGIASFLPYALRRAGILPDTPSYSVAIERYWGKRWTLSDDVPDVPLYPFDESKRGLVYIKSYRIQHLLFGVLGASRYRKFVRGIARQKPGRNAAVFRHLLQYRRINWRRFLSGWVLGAQYKQISLGEFLEDADSDGLSRAEERARGLQDTEYDTDGDSLPDGSEVLLNSNPRKADSDAQQQILSNGPFCDGGDGEWQYFSGVTQAADPSSDQSGVEWTDLTELAWLLKNDTLHLLVRTAATPQRVEDIFFDVLVDIDSDYSSDQQFAFYLKNPANPWQYDDDHATSTNPLELYSAMGAYFELRIPVSLIGASSFRILPIVRDSLLGQNLDEWNAWVPVE